MNHHPHNSRPHNTQTYEMKTIIHDTVKQSCIEAIHESLRILGVDVDHPHETQADMHYLRRSRLSAQNIWGYLLRSASWAALCGAGFLAYEYIKRTN